jgi:hypothetical protein
MASERLTINSPHVVHETIDGETILIHLGTGAYYSLDGAGATIWNLLAAGLSEDEVTARLASGGGVDRAAVEQAVESLAVELLHEELLTHLADDTASGSASRVAEIELEIADPFVAPVLHKYTDMQEFMLVDPIHDVDADAGWPHVKAG